MRKSLAVASLEIEFLGGSHNNIVADRRVDRALLGGSQIVGAHSSAGRGGSQAAAFHAAAQFIGDSSVEFRGCFHFGGRSIQVKSEGA